MKSRLHFLLGLTLMAGSQASLAATAALSDGTIVDWSNPGSQVWRLTGDGRRTPLWNGVYTLRDGGQLTIRNGVLATRPWSSDGVPPGEGLCQQLVNRVCGADGRCSADTTCKLARQMDAMERQTGQSRAHGDTASEPSQCQIALQDRHYFKPCR